MVFNSDVVILSKPIILKTFNHLKEQSYMKRFFYFFFIFSASQALFSQNTEPIGTTPETKSIDKQLEDIHQKTKTFIDPKYEKSLLHLKSQSQKLGYDDGVLRSGDYLLGLYVGVENDKKAAELATELKKVAKDKKDEYGHISSIYRRSGLTLGYLGLSDASLIDSRKAIELAQDVKNDDKKRRLLAFAYNNLNVYYNNRKNEKGAVDSMYSNFKKGLEMAKMISDNNNVVSINEKYDLIADANMQIGNLYLDHNKSKNRLSLAEKYLYEALKTYENKKYKVDPANKARAFYSLSRFHNQKKEPQKAIDYGLQALENEKQHSTPYIRLQSYKVLLEAYLENNDTENSKLYQNKYSKLLDSINYAERQASNSTMKKMVVEVDNKHIENYKKQWIISAILIFIAAIGTVIYWKKRNKILRKNYEQIIEKIKNEQVLEDQKREIVVSKTEEEHQETHEEPQASSSKFIISAETEERILKRLSAFEKSEKFLKKDFTITILAGQLNTNTKYLSEIIKKHKEQTFSSYINTLRINYILQKLYNEPKYRGYKMSYLAEACGFASPQVFVFAFRKINGMNPSYFVQSLKEDALQLDNFL